MSDKEKKEEQPTPPADQSGVLRQPTPAPANDPLEGAHKNAQGVWVNKEGVPLSEADATLASQRLTTRGEPRKG